MILFVADFFVGGKRDEWYQDFVDSGIHLYKNTELVSKRLDIVRGQGLMRFKNGAYTLVREYFEPDRNAAIGQ